MKNAAAVLGILLLLSACQQDEKDKKEITGEQTQDTIAAPADINSVDTLNVDRDAISVDTLQVRKPKIKLADLGGKQSFHINGNKTETIFGSSGTLISFQEDAFATVSGNKYSGEVVIQIIEKYEILPEDTLLYLLASGNGDLNSLGILYLSAESPEGKPLKIHPLKHYYIEFSSYEGVTKDIQVYYSELSDLTEPNWMQLKDIEVRDKAANLNNIMIPLPLEVLDFNVDILDEELKDRLKSHKYEKTIIATRAFESRLHFTANALKDTETDLLNDIVKIYMSSLDKFMFLADREAYKFLLNKVKAADNKEIRSILRDLANTYRNISFQKLTNPLNMSPYGIDLTEKYAYNKLLSKNVSEDAAKEFIQMIEVRNAIIKKRKSGSKEIPVVRNFFRLRDTGWLNIAAVR